MSVGGGVGDVVLAATNGDYKAAFAVLVAIILALAGTLTFVMLIVGKIGHIIAKRWFDYFMQRFEKLSNTLQKSMEVIEAIEKKLIADSYNLNSLSGDFNDHLIIYEKDKTKLYGCIKEVKDLQNAALEKQSLHGDRLTRLETIVDRRTDKF